MPFMMPGKNNHRPTFGSGRWQGGDARGGRGDGDISELQTLEGGQLPAGCKRAASRLNNRRACCAPVFRDNPVLVAHDRGY